MIFLLDTNACIDFLLGRNKVLANRMAANIASLAVSMITVAELRVGSKHSIDPESDEQRLDAFLAMVTAHPFDERAAATYGKVARRAGVRRSSFDRLIGAHALALGATLVTRNAKDFAEIAGLKLADWTK